MAYKGKAQYSEILNLDFSKITKKEELRKLRKTEDPLLVIKMGSKFYFAKVDKDFSLPHSIYKKDECAKICHCRERSCLDFRYKQTTHMEDYEWIIVAFETINTDQESLVIVKCMKTTLKRERIRLPIDDFELER